MLSREPSLLTCSPGIPSADDTDGRLHTGHTRAGRLSADNPRLLSAWQQLYFCFLFTQAYFRQRWLDVAIPCEVARPAAKEQERTLAVCHNNSFSCARGGFRGEKIPGSGRTGWSENCRANCSISAFLKRSRNNTNRRQVCEITLANGWLSIQNSSFFLFEHTRRRGEPESTTLPECCVSATAHLFPVSD